MIPKIIHYCWFGGKPLPEMAEKCIASWRKYNPGYQIKRWDENNFDLECDFFPGEAYQVGRWAFVSDYARLKIIYENGGIYLDTDVEVIKSLDELLSFQCFLGAETDGYIATGLGFGAEKGSTVVGKMLDAYKGKHFQIGRSKYLVKWSLGEKSDTTIRLYYPFILFPHGIQVNYAVPFISCCSIGQIAKYHINAAVRNIRHEL